MWAARKGDVSVVRHLLTRDSTSVDYRDELQRTPVHWAAVTANLDLFRLLLSRGANFHAESIVSQSMLHLCNLDYEGEEAADMYHGSSSNRKVIALELLSRGLPVDIRDSDSRTPLMFAAMCGLEDNVTMLISKGADSSIPDRNGCPPLVRAAQKRHMGILKVIIDGQKDTKRRVDVCLVLAASKGMKSAVKSLLDAGMMIETTNAAGHTALIGAIIECHDDIVRLLLERGANVESKGQSQLRPIMWALDRRHEHKQDQKSQFKATD